MLAFTWLMAYRSVPSKFVSALLITENVASNRRSSSSSSPGNARALFLLRRLPVPGPRRRSARECRWNRDESFVGHCRSASLMVARCKAAVVARPGGDQIPAWTPSGARPNHFVLAASTMGGIARAGRPQTHECRKKDQGVSGSAPISVKWKKSKDFLCIDRSTCAITISMTSQTDHEPDASAGTRPGRWLRRTSSPWAASSWNTGTACTGWSRCASTAAFTAV